MKRLSAALALATLIAVPALARADAASGVPTAAEKPFVDAVSADLNARFPTPADAERAGYLRYTREDTTGAISYANRQWSSADEKHPSQLWYDAHGRLLGADFSVPLRASPPHLFGLQPSRWQTFMRHDHFGLVNKDGTMTYAGTSPKKIESVGGDPAHPTAQNLVALGFAKSAGDVKFAFEFPAIWDVSVWVIPNANGAFADANPAVKPVNPPTSNGHM